MFTMAIVGSGEVVVEIAMKDTWRRPYDYRSKPLDSYANVFEVQATLSKQAIRVSRFATSLDHKGIQGGLGETWDGMQDYEGWGALDASRLVDDPTGTWLEAPGRVKAFSSYRNNTASVATPMLSGIVSGVDDRRLPFLWHRASYAGFDEVAVDPVMGTGYVVRKKESAGQKKHNSGMVGTMFWVGGPMHAFPYVRIEPSVVAYPQFFRNKDTPSSLSVESPSGVRFVQAQQESHTQDMASVDFSQLAQVVSLECVRQDIQPNIQGEGVPTRVSRQLATLHPGTSDEVGSKTATVQDRFATAQGEQVLELGWSENMNLEPSFVFRRIRLAHARTDEMVRAWVFGAGTCRYELKRQTIDGELGESPVTPLSVTVASEVKGFNVGTEVSVEVVGDSHVPLNVSELEKRLFSKFVFSKGAQAKIRSELKANARLVGADMQGSVSFLERVADVHGGLPLHRPGMSVQAGVVVSTLQGNEVREVRILQPVDDVHGPYGFVTGTNTQDGDRLLFSRDGGIYTLKIGDDIDVVIQPNGQKEPLLLEKTNRISSMSGIGSKSNAAMTRIGISNVELGERGVSVHDSGSWLLGGVELYGWQKVISFRQIKVAEHWSEWEGFGL